MQIIMSRWKAFTGHDVFGDDLHVRVTVGTRMFMPEADHMTELVNHNPQLIAILADTDRLRAVSSLAHERATTEKVDSVRTGL